jgi:hypothetical protein
MSRIQLDATPFGGRTSPPPWRLPQERLECSSCGSSLAGRRQTVRTATIAGTTFEVDGYRCRCGRGRHVRREVAAS